MAQAEDTELRDLVIEALEKNGSLAKIRALLRANIFLAFEDECENIKQNVNLDNILKLPEGILALSVIHEFLEFCCLKNTLFVYMSESRQGNEYNYDGKKSLADKLSINRGEAKEPILLTLIKNMLKPHLKNTINSSLNNQNSDKVYREEQNCTYILHDDSQNSTTSNSNSDNSSDEKNKLHLRLQLDNSDTDTSSDSTRDKSSSEYIPGDHILETNMNRSNLTTFISQKPVDSVDGSNFNTTVPQEKSDKSISLVNKDVKPSNTSSDSTSYIELKPFNSLDAKMLNTAGLPVVQQESKSTDSSKLQLATNTQVDISTPKTGTLSSSTHMTPMSPKDNENKDSDKTQNSAKSDGETADFSYGDDFSSSPVSKVREGGERKKKPEDILQDEFEKSPNKNSSVESPHQSSQSSVSLSDVADLISEKSSLSNTNNKSIHSPSIHSKDKKDVKSNRLQSDDSGDFTESPIPSLSNLSLDINSD